MKYITLLLILSIAGRCLADSHSCKDDDDSDSSDDDDDRRRDSHKCPPTTKSRAATSTAPLTTKATTVRPTSFPKTTTLTTTATTTQIVTTKRMASPTAAPVPKTTQLKIKPTTTLKQLIQQNNSHNTHFPVTQHTPIALHSTKQPVSALALGKINPSSTPRVFFTPKTTTLPTRSSTASTTAMHVTGQHSSYPTDLTTADHSTASTTATHVTGQPSSYATDLTTADYSAASTTATHVTGQPSSYATDLTTAYHTSQKLATNRQKAITCAVCAGPPEACELAYYEDTCQSPDNYCINHVTNLMTGDRLVERKCGNITECHNGWYMGTSDDDKCRQLSSSTHLTFRFECTFCCVTDSCNVDLRPRPDTLYTNA